MFTGIVQAMGEIVSLTPKSGDVVLRIRTDALDLSVVGLGDSIAVNGVCLTAVTLPGDHAAGRAGLDGSEPTGLGGLVEGGLSPMA